MGTNQPRADEFQGPVWQRVNKLEGPKAVELDRWGVARTEVVEGIASTVKLESCTNLNMPN